MGSLPLFDSTADDLVARGEALAHDLAALPEEARVDALNRIRTALHEASPFRGEPVDLVLWVRAEQVRPNDYNPNVVHTPEWKLLIHSLRRWGFAMGIASHREEDGSITVVDGEHRHRAGSTDAALSRRLRGYVPVSILDTHTPEDRMAATVDFNRARGVHQLDGMTRIVLALAAAGWTDDEISRSMGMDADEILRLKQVSGVVAAFARPAYNRAWINDDGRNTVD